MGSYRRREDLSFHRVGDEVVVYDPRAQAAHLLPPSLAVVFEALDEGSLSQLAARAFPDRGAKEATRLVKEALAQLSSKGLLCQDGRMTRRQFQKKAAAAVFLPPIVSLALPCPAAAQSAGCNSPVTYNANASTTIPPCAMTVSYTIIGGSGGGGGGGGGGLDAAGGAGGTGGLGETVTGTRMVTAGQTLTIVVGTGGLGGEGGTASSSSAVGAGGDGGNSGSPNGDDGDNGSNGMSPGTDFGGGGGGGGGSGGRSSIDSPSSGMVNAQGGTGGGGGEGGGGGVTGVAGQAGTLGGMGGSGGSMAGGDGGAGGNREEGNGDGPGGGGSGGLIGLAGGSGSPGAAGSVTITFLP